MKSLLRLLIVGVAIVAPATTAASASAKPHPRPDRLFAIEERFLGRAHALEHLAARRNAARARRRQRSRRRARAAAALPPGMFGRWLAPTPLGAPAIHAALLPTGKILYFSYPFAVDSDTIPPQLGDAWLWDPATGTAKNVPPPPDGDHNDSRPAQIFCAGQSLLADGRLLVTGGTLEWEQPPIGYKGHYMALIFDPWHEVWVVQNRMRRGRWYPAQRLLDDNRTIVMGGTDETGVATDDDVELFTPNADGWWKPGSFAVVASRPVSQYAHVFQLPDRRVVVAGPGNGIDGPFWTDSAIASPTTWQWDFVLPRQSRTRAGSTAIQWHDIGGGGTQITQIGGVGGSGDATDTSESIDFAGASPTWRVDAPKLNIRRSYHNTVQLPDGSLVTVGGGAGKPNGSLYGLDPGAPQRQVELWDAATKTWRLGPAQAEDRAYHSVAMLLPDGTVWSAGDDDPADGRGQDTSEIYQPPYLFRGERPAITWSPKEIGWGQSFNLHVSGPAVTRATLIAPSAVTHASDMSGAAYPLAVSGASDDPRRVTVTAPSGRAVAPEGYYMLFALTEDGVPSVASWVHLTDVAQPQPAEPALTDRTLEAPTATPASSDAGNAQQTVLEAVAPPDPATAVASGNEPSAAVPVMTPVRYRLDRRAARVALERRWVRITDRPWSRAVIVVRVNGRVAGRRRVTTPGSARVWLARWVIRYRGKSPTVTITVSRAAR